MQFLSMPLAVPNCGLVDDAVTAQRVGSDPSARLPPEEVAEQIAEAKERYADRLEDGPPLFWMFHNRGGTHEMFFASTGTAGPQAVFGQHGASMLCSSVRGRYQAEIDLEQWDEYFEDTLDVEFEWVKEE